MTLLERIKIQPDKIFVNLPVETIEDPRYAKNIRRNAERAADSYIDAWNQRMQGGEKFGTGFSDLLDTEVDAVTKLNEAAEKGQIFHNAEIIGNGFDAEISALKNKVDHANAEITSWAAESADSAIEAWNKRMAGNGKDVKGFSDIVDSIYIKSEEKAIVKLERLAKEVEDNPIVASIDVEPETAIEKLDRIAEEVDGRPIVASIDFDDTAVTDKISGKKGLIESIKTIFKKDPIPVTDIIDTSLSDDTKFNSDIFNILNGVSSGESLDSVIDKFGTDGDLANAIRETIDELGGLDEAILTNTDDMVAFTDIVKEKMASSAGNVSDVGDAVVEQSKTWGVLGKVVAGVGKTIATIGVQMLAAFAIAEIMKAINNWIHRVEIAKEKIEELTQDIKELNRTLEDNVAMINEASESYYELSKGVDIASGKNISLNDEDFKKWNDLSKELAQRFPSLITGWRENGTAIVDLGDNANEANEKLQEVLKTEEEIAAYKISEKLDDLVENAGVVFSDNRNKLDKLNKEIEELQSKDLSGYQIEFDAEIYNDVLDILSQYTEKEHGFTEELNKRLDDWNTGESEDLDFSGLIDLVSDGNKAQVQGLIDNIELKIKNSDSQKISDYASLINDKFAEKMQIEAENAARWADIMPSIITTITHNGAYSKLDSKTQNVAKQIITSLDSSILDEAKKSGERVQDYITRTILAPLYRVQNDEKGSGLLNRVLGVTNFDDWISAYNDFKQYCYDNKIEIPVELINPSDKISLTQEAISKFVDPSKSDYQSKEEWIKSLSESDLRILMSVEIDPQATTDELKNAVEEAKQNVTPIKIPTKIDTEYSDIAGAVSGIATRLKPQFDALGNLAQKIFYGDNGSFSLDKIGTEELQALSDQFLKIGEEIGVTFEDGENAVNEFIGTITSAETKSKSLSEQTEITKNAFNKLATKYFNSANGLKELNANTADSIEQQLKMLGIENAHEIVQERLNAQLAAHEAQAEAVEKAQSDMNGETENATKDFLEEAKMSNLAKVYLANLVAAETVFNNTDLDTAGKIEALSELAAAYFDAAAQASFLNKVNNTAAGGHGAISAEEAWKQVVDEFTTINVDEIEFNPSIYNDARNAGSKAGEEFKNAFEKKLEGMNAAISAIGTLFSSKISAANSAKDAAISSLNEEKEAAISAIKAEQKAKVDAINAEIKAIDKQIKAYQEQQEALQKQIKAIEDANAARTRALNLQKAIYELNRSENQRSKLVA